MTFQTITQIAGLNRMGQPGLDAVRVARAAMGMLIAGFGVAVISSEGAPLVWAAIQHILATPAQLQAVKLSAIAGAATGLGGLALLVMKKIDDTLDVFACHGVGGIMGMILTAIFAQGENASLLYGGWSVFSHHMIALVLVAVFTFFGSMLLYKVTNFIIPLRVSEESEQIGLDVSQHDEQF